MKQKSKNELGRFGLLATGLALFAACGGRAILEDSGSAGAGAAGTSSAGARSTTGGTSSTHVGGGRGTTAGTTSSGGTNGLAGATSSGGCGPTACPFVPVCDGPNEMLVVPPGECCAVCQNTCPPCGSPVCPVGSSPQMLPGQCCPTCVANNCDAGKMAYEDTRAQLLAKYSYGCATAADCVAVPTFNACESGCDNTAILKPVANDWQTNLASSAAKDCSSCAPTPVPPCVPDVRQPACLNGQCVLPPK